MKVAQDEAGRFASRLLQSAGAEPDDADVVARALVDAERLGQGGHGLARLPGYVGRLRSGGTVSGLWQLVHAAGSVEAYDGRAGFGHVHIQRAVQRAAHLCEDHGLGLVGVANSNHGGALGVHARGLADAGLVGVLVTNGPAVIAPPGGRDAVLGTNPIALAAPVPDGPPLVCGEVPWDGAALGELALRGASVIDGYFREAPAPGGWLRTGDVGTLADGGIVRVVDRAKDLIKSGGEWIPSANLEDAIAVHPAVAEVAVVGRQDARWGERPVAVVVVKAGQAWPGDELRLQLADRVARWWIPDDFVALDALPRTSVGKIDKKALRRTLAKEER